MSEVELHGPAKRQRRLPRVRKSIATLVLFVLPILVGVLMPQPGLLGGLPRLACQTERRRDIPVTRMPSYVRW
jgi:hypothetical protein